MQAALVHQRAGHHLVVHEVAFDEPLLRLNIVLGADESDAEATAGRIEDGHAIHQPQHSRREFHRLLQRQIGEWGTEGGGQITAVECPDLVGVQGASFERDQRLPVGGTLPGHGESVEFRLDDALPGGESFRTEETGDAIRHAQQWDTVDTSFEPESEEPRIGLAEKLVDVNVVFDAFPDAWQLAVKGHPGV